MGLGIVAVLIGVIGAAAWSGRPSLVSVVKPSPDSVSSNRGPAGAVVNINGIVADGTVAGTGMVISSNGIVLTNNHVIADTTALTGQVDGTGPIYNVTVVGVDPTEDIAVLRLENATNLSAIALNTSGETAVGDPVTVLGNALGRNAVPIAATGVVTSLDETIVVSDATHTLTETLNGMIGFNATIQPGDSGGPLLDAKGRVIGMNTAGSSVDSRASASNEGFAIPITTALSIAHQIEGGVVSPYLLPGHRGALGVVTQVGTHNGALVAGVTAGGPAAAAGIVSNDVITNLGGIEVGSVNDLEAALLGRRPGETTTITWRRPTGSIHNATIVLTAGPPA